MCPVSNQLSRLFETAKLKKKKKKKKKKKQKMKFPELLKDANNDDDNYENISS